MGGLFSSPEKTKMPVVPEPEPAPEVVSEDIEKDVSSRAKRRHGRKDTILTGDLEPVTTKKTLLG